MPIKSLRKRVFERDNHICQYCGKPVIGEESVTDHIIPKSKGGKKDFDNLITSCRLCNALKGPLYLEGFREKMFDIISLNEYQINYFKYLKVDFPKILKFKFYFERKRHGKKQSH